MKKSALLLLAIIFAIAFDTCAQQSAPEASAKTTVGCPDVSALEKRIEDMNGRLQDWPLLARYREANRTVTAPVQDEPRVVFMGDSITDGWQQPKNGGFFPGKPYIDRGISGQTTPQMLLRFRTDVIDLHPKVVVILAGTNDIAGNTGPLTLQETEGYLASMSELGHAHDIRVVIASVTPVSDFTTSEGRKLVQTERRPPEKILTLNEWIKKYAAEHGDTYLNYFPAMSDDQGALKSELTYDGLHPNAAGYTVMAPLAEKAIAEALALKH